MSIPFEQLSSTTGIKIRAYGKTPEELFENAARGIFESIHPTINEKKPATNRLLATDATSLEELLTNFLTDCLYLSSTNHEVYRELEFLEFNEKHLHASLIGMPYAQLQSEIQGIKSTELKKEKGHYSATVVLG